VKGDVDMSRIAFLFPGQGAQYAGMGKDFYEQFDICRGVFAEAQEASGMDLTQLCFEENDLLNITEYTQVALLTTEVAILRVIERLGIKPAVAAGLSLGEYASLAAGKVMSDGELFQIVRKRGLYMQEACPEGGAMVAVLGLDAETIEKICREQNGQVYVANYNCPGQLVITGKADAVAATGARLKEAGAKGIVPLKVSGPFHSPLLNAASEKLAAALLDVDVYTPDIPYITNVTANYVKDAECIKELLAKQVVSSVRWQQSVERMIADGIDTFIEIGPGKSLSGFMKKINREVRIINVGSVDDLSKLETL